MSQQDAAYFRQRAEAEMELALASSSPDAALVHKKMAAAYEARLTFADGASRPVESARPKSVERPTLHLAQPALAAGDG
jgi:hypothetical protein